MTETTRRALLRAAAFGVVLAPFAPARSALAATTATNLYTRARFRRLLYARFRLTSRTNSWSMRLIRVRDLPQAADTRSFSLTFRSATTGPPQGTYTLRRRGFAPTTLFVVPSDASRRTYQVIVNRAP